MTAGAAPRLLLTPGMGVGPEVTVAALLREPALATRLTVIGRATAIAPLAAQAGLRLQRILDPLDPVEAGAIGLVDPGDEGEAAEVAAIRMAAQLCLIGAADAMVTGPIHKKRLMERGFAFSGHTDFLEDICGAGRAVMAFVGGELRVALVTTHIPLMSVGRALKAQDIVRVVATVIGALTRDLGLIQPRVAVCGLNPHAGEEGALGTEEIRIIGPACEALRKRGLAVVGPISAETAFLGARSRVFDVVVAMYHDQGLAPLKAVDFGRSVNWTLGLPIVRTSVDHGTADALVGTGKADCASMVAALQLADAVARRRAAEKTR